MKKRITKILILLFIYLSFFLITYHTYIIKQFNFYITDRLFSDKTRKDIIIVEIDDESLQEIGQWPWDRKEYIEVLKFLDQQQARVIGFDIFFAEPTASDIFFKDTIDNFENTKIVLPIKIHKNQIIDNIITSNNSLFGIINMQTDIDGKIRYYQPFYHINKKNYTTFSQQIINIYNKKLASKYNEKNKLFINYTQNKFPKTSFKDVLNSNLNFKDKIVLIGISTNDIKSNVNDTYINIYGQEEPLIYLHGNIINSYLNESFLKPINLKVYMIILTIIILIQIYLIYKYFNNLLINFSSTFLLLIIFNIIGIILFEYNIIFNFISGTILIITNLIIGIFYKYLKAYKENLYLKNIFSKYVNKKILNKILQNPNNIKLDGENKIITILFSDIRDFTKFSEITDAHYLIKILNAYLNTMSQIIFKYDGIIDKFIGDAILALWNVPIDDLLHTTKAVHCALEMNKQLEIFNNKFNTAFKFGIGINTDFAIIGNIGGKQKIDYTAIGDSVNLASRLEGLTKKYGCNILITKKTQNSYKKELKNTQNQFNFSVIFRKIDIVQVKGRSSKTIIYQPLIRNKKNLKLKKDYEQALKLLRQKKFLQAKNILLKLSRTDNPSKVMLDRIEILKSRKNWDGIWIWENK